MLYDTFFACLLKKKNPKLPHTIIDDKNKYIKNRIPCRIFLPHERHDRQPTNLSKDSIYYLTRMSISVDFTPKLITFNRLTEQGCTKTPTLRPLLSGDRLNLIPQMCPVSEAVP